MRQGLPTAPSRNPAFEVMNDNPPDHEISLDPPSPTSPTSTLMSSTPTVCPQRPYQQINNHNQQLPSIANDEEYGHPTHRNGFMRLSSMEDMGSGGNNNAAKHVAWCLGPSKRPYFTWLCAAAMLVAFVIEVAKNRDLTGSLIQVKPFNPMVGPKFTVMIHVGARYTPCMRPLPDYSPSTIISDCNISSNSTTCTLSELCGPTAGGYRLLSAIFLHTGIIHLALNLLVHCQLGAMLEPAIGSLGYAFLYLSSGVLGFSLSSLVSEDTAVSVGCSGALMGVVGYLVLDTVGHWRHNNHHRPVRRLLSIILSLMFAFVFGLFPGIDNFAHLGITKRPTGEKRGVSKKNTLSCYMYRRSFDRYTDRSDGDSFLKQGVDMADACSFYCGSPVVSRRHPLCVLCRARSRSGMPKLSRFHLHPRSELVRALAVA